jgi:hypothetical protein
MMPFVRRNRVLKGLPMKTTLFVFAFALVSLSASAQDVQGPTPPSYCKPCLFYGGDFDPANPNSSGLTDEDTSAYQATTYVAFYVPAGEVWTVKGLFSNVLSNIQYIIPKQIEWSISTGISTGDSGTVLASGTADATWTPTGRSWRGFTEYTALGRLTPETAVTLDTGVYWMTAVPVCTQSGNGRCLSAFYMLSDVEDVPAPNHKGTQPNDDAFFNSPSEGVYYIPAWGADGACAGGCDKFSAGLLGDARPQ